MPRRSMSLTTRRLQTTGGLQLSGGGDARGGPVVARGGLTDFLEDLARKGGEAVIEGAGDVIRRQFAPGSGDGPFQPCPEGQKRVGDTCVRFDFGAALPGGDRFISTTTAGGVAVMGAFGIPAMAPDIVGERNGRPIRQCRPGAILGKDDLCYMKGSIPAQFRKWKPTPRPVFSRADAKALRRIGSLQKKVKKLAGDANMTCKKR